MKSIPLTKGLVALVDDEDFEFLNQYKWHSSHGYAVRLKGTKGDRMHRVIMNAPSDMFVDHINGNRADNRRANLRVCTPGENGKNKTLFVTNKSGHRGVYWNKNKWRAQICVNRKQIYLGRFDTLEDAAQAYKDAAIKHHGEFASLAI